MDSYEFLKTQKDEIDACNKERDPERQTLIYWLLRAYHSGHREGWEDGPSTDETMDGILSVLSNRGYDPNLDGRAEELLKQPPKF